MGAKRILDNLIFSLDTAPPMNENRLRQRVIAAMLRWVSKRLDCHKAGASDELT